MIPKVPSVPPADDARAAATAMERAIERGSLLDVVMAAVDEAWARSRVSLSETVSRRMGLAFAAAIARLAETWRIPLPILGGAASLIQAAALARYASTEDIDRFFTEQRAYVEQLRRRRASQAPPSMLSREPSSDPQVIH